MGVSEPLDIGIVAPPWVPVPPPVYGGTEMVVDTLARGLVRAGHRVELFATGDSTCPVPTRWLHATALGTGAPPGAEAAHVQEAYARLTEAGVDVVHDHTVAGPVWAATRHPDLPVVTTNHSPFSADLLAGFEWIARRMPLVAISEAHRRSAPSVAVAEVIHHGIDLDAFPLGAGDGGYLLFLGRMSATKGAHRAIAVARAAGRPLVIAAKMREPDEHRYFHDEVEPHLGDDVRYLGEVGGARKLELLGGAEALVNPIRWSEPFGLAMIEALACGTPVLVFPEGAAPEIVEHGRNGFLCADEADMAARVGDVAGLDRATCRASAEERFSLGRFVDRHVSLYRRAIEAVAARSAPPPAPPGPGAGTVLLPGVLGTPS